MGQLKFKILKWIYKHDYSTWTILICFKLLIKRYGIYKIYKMGR